MKPLSTSQLRLSPKEQPKKTVRSVWTEVWPMRYMAQRLPKPPQTRNSQCVLKYFNLVQPLSTWSLTNAKNSGAQTDGFERVWTEMWPMWYMFKKRLPAPPPLPHCLVLGLLYMYCIIGGLLVPLFRACASVCLCVLSWFLLYLMMVCVLLALTVFNDGLWFCYSRLPTFRAFSISIGLPSLIIVLSTQIKTMGKLWKAKSEAFSSPWSPP